MSKKVEATMNTKGDKYKMENITLVPEDSTSQLDSLQLPCTLTFKPSGDNTVGYEVMLEVLGGDQLTTQVIEGDGTKMDEVPWKEGDGPILITWPENTKYTESWQIIVKANLAHVTPHVYKQYKSPAVRLIVPKDTDGNSKAHLKAHNKYRKQLQDLLSWDDRLAQEAGDWAKKMCYGDQNAVHHDSARGQGHETTTVGENIYWGTLTNPESDLGKQFKNSADSAEGWSSEKEAFEAEVKAGIRDFNYRQQDPQIGHYTQMVWKDTKKVGGACAYRFNEETNEAQYVFVSRYTPGGNITGKTPYELTAAKPDGPISLRINQPITIARGDVGKRYALPTASGKKYKIVTTGTAVADAGIMVTVNGITQIPETSGEIRFTGQGTGTVVTITAPGLKEGNTLEVVELIERQTDAQTTTNPVTQKGNATGGRTIPVTPEGAPPEKVEITKEKETLDHEVLKGSVYRIEVQAQEQKAAGTLTLEVSGRTHHGKDSDTVVKERQWARDMRAWVDWYGYEQEVISISVEKSQAIGNVDIKITEYGIAPSIRKSAGGLKPVVQIRSTDEKGEDTVEVKNPTETTVLMRTEMETEEGEEIKARGEVTSDGLGLGTYSIGPKAALYAVVEKGDSLVLKTKSEGTNKRYKVETVMVQVAPATGWQSSEERWDEYELIPVQRYVYLPPWQMMNITVTSKSEAVRLVVNDHRYETGVIQGGKEDMAEEVHVIYGTHDWGEIVVYEVERATEIVKVEGTGRVDVSVRTRDLGAGERDTMVSRMENKWAELRQGVEAWPWLEEVEKPEEIKIKVWTQEEVGRKLEAGPEEFQIDMGGKGEVMLTVGVPPGRVVIFQRPEGLEARMPVGHGTLVNEEGWTVEWKENMESILLWNGGSDVRTRRWRYEGEAMAPVVHTLEMVNRGMPRLLYTAEEVMGEWNETWRGRKYEEGVEVIIETPPRQWVRVMLSHRMDRNPSVRTVSKEGGTLRDVEVNVNWRKPRYIGAPWQGGLGIAPKNHGAVAVLWVDAEKAGEIQMNASAVGGKEVLVSRGDKILDKNEEGLFQLF